MSSSRDDHICCCFFHTSNVARFARPHARTEAWRSDKCSCTTAFARLRGKQRNAFQLSAYMTTSNLQLEIAQLQSPKNAFQSGGPRPSPERPYSTEASVMIFFCDNDKALPLPEQFPNDIHQLFTKSKGFKFANQEVRVESVRGARHVRAVNTDCVHII